MALAPEEKISYKEGGAAALANFEAGAAGFEARAFRGCGVVTSDPFEVSDDQESIQMLQRYSQVGEFYVMSAPAIPPKPNQKGFMDIMVYDEESDRHVKITYRQAIEATGLFTAGADGTLTDVAPNGSYGRKPDGSEKVIGDVNMEGGQTLDAWKGKAEALLQLNEKGADLTAGEIKIISDSKEDAPVVLARPFIEHAMLSAVLAVSGADTGATIFGPSDMQISVRLRPLTHRIPAPHTIWNTIRCWNDMDFDIL
jgi:hypothetical protein